VLVSFDHHSQKGKTIKGKTIVLKPQPGHDGTKKDKMIDDKMILK
jgi:hypothetical protein